MAIIYFAAPDQSGGGAGNCTYVSDEYEASVAGVWLTGAEAMVVRINRSIQPVFQYLRCIVPPPG